MNINIYPNPVSDYINIKSSLLIDQIHLFDYTGKLILTQQPTDQNEMINVQSLNKGSYIIVLQIDKQEFKQRILIQ